MSLNAALFLLVGCALWVPANAGIWVAAEVECAGPVEPPGVPTFTTIEATQRAEAPTGSQSPPDSGLSLFLRNGCGACHAIRGTEAHGTIGPDLSHVGSRRAIGAGVLPNTEEAIARFIARPDLLKPGVKMPAFDMLPQIEIQTIARYLKALQ
ncbi:c-type cytochrome [Mesorhizobium sp. B263B2A]|uniref:c-type cytochrome n=1 Tax=Mesorhizobium sp. B263B2A TaxID=2876669 RepID=UPI001CD070F0|nr:c-type cytochrome [Mesorhizobium sp. B263B2A]MCA0032128.1 c-type cytochrome [Mesorhizobium sp. B263B2A]